MKHSVFYLLAIVVIMAIITLNQNQRKRIKFQEAQIENLQVNLKKAIDKTAISFSISPEITNKVTSAFGSTKNVTLQYYFTLDGKAMIAKPDSVYTVFKEY
jgi:hypothetical protein